MSDAISLGVWVRRFLLEHLVGERNLARNTQRSYRDALCNEPRLFSSSKVIFLRLIPGSRAVIARADRIAV